jgi:hypothetical protein
MSALLSARAAAILGLATTCLAALGVAGCGSKVPRYYVSAQQHETVPDKLDGQWFTREIWLQNRLEGIELVYCPILADTQDGDVTVCRTAIVWEANHSRLTDAPSDSEKGERSKASAPAETPAAPAPEAPAAPAAEPAPPATPSK